LAKEPIGIAARLWTADLLKSFRRILVQRQFGRAEIAGQMLDRAGTDETIESPTAITHDPAVLPVFSSV
jgi:hypothetical protein